MTENGREALQKYECLKSLETAKNKEPHAKYEDDGWEKEVKERIDSLLDCTTMHNQKSYSEVSKHF